MGRKIDPADKQAAVRHYLACQSIDEAAAAAGISYNALRRELGRRGIEVRNRRIVDLPPEVVDRYLAGESELVLAQSLGTDRAVVRRHLQEAGVPIRGRQAAGLNRASRLTAEQRQAQAQAAHDAVRGVPQPHDHLVRRAQARQANPPAPSAGEKLLLGWLAALKLHPIREKAVDKYNIDIAVADVAVEVLGGKWHGYKATHHARTKTLLDAGWHVVFVWNTATHPLAIGAAEKIHAFVDLSRRHPSLSREYRVLRGDGHLIARGRAENYDLTFVPPARDLAG